MIAPTEAAGLIKTYYQVANCALAQHAREVAMIERIKRTRPLKNNSARPFGPPPLITGEDADAYEQILARVSSQVAPKDFIEEVLLIDIVDLTWEIARLRRLKAGLYNVGAYQSLSNVLRPLLDRDDSTPDSDLDEEALFEKYLEENWARRGTGCGQAGRSTSRPSWSEHGRGERPNTCGKY